MELYMIHLKTKDLKYSAQIVIDWKTFKSNQLEMFQIALKRIRDVSGYEPVKDLADVYNFSGILDNKYVIENAQLFYDNLKTKNDKKVGFPSGYVTEFKPYDRITMAGKLAMQFIYYSHFDNIFVIKESLIVHMSQFPELNSSVGILYNKDDRSLRVFDLGEREIITIEKEKQWD